MFLVLDSSSNMHFTFFTLTTFIFLFFVFWKTIDFAKNLEMTRVAGGRGVMLFVSLWHITCTKIDTWFTPYRHLKLTGFTLYRKSIENKVMMIILIIIVNGMFSSSIIHQACFVVVIKYSRSVFFCILCFTIVISTYSYTQFIHIHIFQDSQKQPSGGVL